MNRLYSKLKAVVIASSEGGKALGRPRRPRSPPALRGPGPKRLLEETKLLVDLYLLF